ncbi:MAG: hypothetical protein ACOH1E_10910 [Brevundimonas sp.]
MIRSATPFAARQSALCGGVGLRAGGLGMTMTMTTITTLMAGNG